MIQSTVPSVSFNPRRTMMFITYNGNDIQVSLKSPCMLEPADLVSDITDDTAVQQNGAILIRNPSRNNHIVAGYDPVFHKLYIHHRKRRYVVNLPPGIRLLSCGGNNIPG